MHDAQLLRLDGALYGCLLGVVEPRETELRQAAERRRGEAEQHTAQADKALVLFAFGLVQGFGHHAEAGVVDTQLHTGEVARRAVGYALGRGLRGQAEAHPPVAHTLHVALVRQLVQVVTRQVEEGGRLSGLEVELHLVVAHLVADVDT